jgi:hypothetical protein
MTDDLERRFREALHREADRITPNDRRAEILAMAHDEAHHEETRHGEPRRRWLVPASAAASVALIAGVIWGVSNNGAGQQAGPAVSQAKTATTAPPAPQKAGPTAAPDRGAGPAKVRAPGALPRQVPAAGPNGNVTGATTQVTLPAYFVGAFSNPPTGGKLGLYREFVRIAVPVGATPAQKAKAAVAVAMNPGSLAKVEAYLQPWSGTSVTNLTATPSRITITLSGPGAPNLTANQTKLAVQELVWTAQAALGKGAIPVKFVIADGSSRLFGTYPTSQTYNRPPADQQFEVLAPIWILSPLRDQQFPAGTAVVATGQSCAFEGTTQWQLRNTLTGTLVKSGVATASSGCPTRGTWQVKLGVLGAGSYSFRMYEVSMQNGTGIVAETTKPFTVR